MPTGAGHALKGRQDTHGEIDVMGVRTCDENVDLFVHMVADQRSIYDVQLDIRIFSQKLGNEGGDEFPAEGLRGPNAHQAMRRLPKS